MAVDPTGGLTGWDLTGFGEGHDTECWKRLGAIEEHSALTTLAPAAAPTTKPEGEGEGSSES